MRISKVSNGMIKGGYALEASTVHSNGSPNTVSDGHLQSQNQNCFIANSSDSCTQQDKTVTIINT